MKRVNITGPLVVVATLLAALVFQSQSRADEAAERSQRDAAKPRPESAALPAHIQPGVVTKLRVLGDKSVLVIHAPAGTTRAIVYLHGYCGNIRAIEDFEQAAAAHGTLIALRAGIACGGGRFRWGNHLGLIQARIRRALAAVKKDRAGQLDLNDVVLFGYSQGAARAERLAALFPKTYSRVVLGGPPRKPKVSLLRRVRAVAVFGGEDEDTEHMRQGVQELTDHGKLSHFFMLPAAKHGEYGPKGNRVIDRVLSWVVETGKNG